MTDWDTEDTAGLEDVGVPLLPCPPPLLTGDMIDPPPFSGDAPFIVLPGLQLSPAPTPTLMLCAAVLRLNIRGATIPLLAAARAAASLAAASVFSERDGIDADGVW